ncbi:hypothetical protein Btru_045230 [Bulinus truncatus]|nr:hypothetical protein Btru_045230 [Bulinus truncatus]
MSWAWPDNVMGRAVNIMGLIRQCHGPGRKYHGPVRTMTWACPDNVMAWPDNVMGRVVNIMGLAEQCHGPVRTMTWACPDNVMGLAGQCHGPCRKYHGPGRTMSWACPDNVMGLRFVEVDFMRCRSEQRSRFGVSGPANVKNNDHGGSGVVYRDKRSYDDDYGMTTNDLLTGQEEKNGNELKVANATKQTTTTTLKG